MEGKTLVVVGSAGLGRQTAWTSFKSYGLKVVLFDTHSINHGMASVDLFLHYDYNNPSMCFSEHADKMINLLKSYDIHADGVYTFLDKYIDLMVLLCTKLNLPSMGQDVAYTVTHKYEVLKILKKNPKTTGISCQAAKIIDRQDLAYELESFSFPVVMKPDAGTGSNFVRLVTSKAECLAEYEEIEERFHPEQRSTAPEMFLMEYICGTNHRVDIVMFQGEVVIALVADAAPSIPHRFVETAHCMPSRLDNKNQSVLSTAAAKCCKALGLLNGVFNFELTLTDKGPKLIEINGRVCRLDRKDLLQKTFGVDLLRCACSIAFGMHPRCSLKRSGYALNVLCYPSLHGKLLEYLLDDGILLRGRNTEEKGLIQNYPRGASASKIDTSIDKPYFSMYVYKETFELAKASMLQHLRELGFNNLEHNLEIYINYFE